MLFSQNRKYYDKIFGFFFLPKILNCLFEMQRRKELIMKNIKASLKLASFKLKIFYILQFLDLHPTAFFQCLNLHTST